MKYFKTLMQQNIGMVYKSIITVVFLFYSIFVNAQTGIGTTTPVNKFEVVTATADPANTGTTANGNLRLGPSSGLHVLDFGLSSSSTYAWLQARSKSAYGTTYNLVLNPIGGNVGIGTTNPTAKLNLVGGGIRMFDGFNNSTSRPALNTSTIGNYEIRGVGAGGGTTQGDGADDGFLRLSAGGGTNANTQASIDLSGYSNVADMGSNIVMRTAGMERLRIKADGKVGVGITEPATTLHIENGNSIGSGAPDNTNVPSIYVFNNNNASSTANAIVAVRTAGTGSGKPYISFDAKTFAGYSMGFNNPTDQFIINTDWNFNTTSASKNAIIINETGQSRVILTSSGGSYANDWPSGWGGGLTTYDISATGIYANGYVTRSDLRLKNTINEFGADVIEKYLRLRPITYYWNQEMPRDTKMQYGLIAQEVEKLFPEMVLTASDSMQTKSVNYQALHAISLKVIQAQQQEIEALKKKQTAFEARLLKLETKLNQP